MQYGVSVPPFADFFHPRTLANLAHDAEAAGWDGFFIWDHVLIWPTPLCDPWVSLAAIALATSKVKIGALVTPMPRRRPVKLARETLGIDHLSNGRLIFGAGSGAGPWEYDYLGEERSPKLRGEMLDEGLDLLTKLWTGEPLVHHGRFYEFRGDGGPGKPEEAPTPVLPAPVQKPRPPIWLGGSWPIKAPFRRAARFDGVLALKANTIEFGDYLTPDDIAAIGAFIKQHRQTDAPFALVGGGHTRDQTDVALVAEHADAGATWWIEDVSPWAFGWYWEGPWPVDAMVERIRTGPPTLAG